MNLQTLNAFLQSLPPSLCTSIEEISRTSDDDEAAAPTAGLGCSNTICLPQRN